MKILIGLLVLLLAGCGSRGSHREVLETSPQDPSKATKTLLTNSRRPDREQVVSNNVTTSVYYTLKDRSALKSHSGQVCLLAGLLPTEFKYHEIGRITATKRTYGGVDEVLRAMADEGRRIGVEAIMGLQAEQKFRGPLPWRYNSPVGDGKLVKLDADSPPLECEKLGGHPE